MENKREIEISVKHDRLSAVNLGRYLSVKSVLSASALSAISQEENTEEKQRKSFAEIGRGFCAAIFDWPARGLIVKRAHQITGKNAILWNDFQLHREVYGAIVGAHAPAASCRIDSLSVPAPQYFVKAEEVPRWTEKHQDEMPPSPSEPTSVLIAERINPLPPTIRNDLIRVFCPPESIESAARNPDNRDCLVRIYLGVRRPVFALKSQSAHGDFSLRNFELTLDRMDHLGLDPMQFIPTMAEALAVMHYICKQDAGDVEFVLGSPSSQPINQSISTEELEMLTDDQEESTTPRVSVRMWLLDFNNASTIDLDEAGVKKAAGAFWENDPYYPRPTPAAAQNDLYLWDAFKGAYFEKVEKMGLNQGFGMAFFDKVEEMGSNRGHAPSAGPPKSGPPSGLSNEKQKRGKGNGKKQRQYAPCH